MTVHFSFTSLFHTVHSSSLKTGAPSVILELENVSGLPPDTPVRPRGEGSWWQDTNSTRKSKLSQTYFCGFCSLFKNMHWPFWVFSVILFAFNEHFFFKHKSYSCDFPAFISGLFRVPCPAYFWCFPMNMSVLPLFFVWFLDCKACYKQLAILPKQSCRQGNSHALNPWEKRELSSLSQSAPSFLTLACTLSSSMEVDSVRFGLNHCLIILFLCFMEDRN